MKAKIKSREGETLIEFLIAMTISAMFMFMVVNALSVGVIYLSKIFHRDLYQYCAQWALNHYPDSQPEEYGPVKILWNVNPIDELSYAKEITLTVYSDFFDDAPYVITTIRYFY